MIIEAAKILSPHLDIKFRFCGDGQIKEAIMELSKKYALKNVEFLGFVPHETLQNELKKRGVNKDIQLGEGKHVLHPVLNLLITQTQESGIKKNILATRKIGMKARA